VVYFIPWTGIPLKRASLMGRIQRQKEKRIKTDEIFKPLNEAFDKILLTKDHEMQKLK